MPSISVNHVHVFNNHPLTIDTAFPAVGVFSGVESPISNLFITARRAANTPTIMNRVGLIELVRQTGTTTFESIATADRPKVETLYRNIENYAYSSSTYRDIKTNVLWKQIYAVQAGAIDYWNKKTPASTKMVDKAFCLGACGLHLPLSVLTIDHQRPQSLTGLEVLMRMFRGMGLTMGAPAGFKNTQMMARWANDVGGNPDSTRSKDKDDQNTLSMQGVLYFSIFRHIGVPINELKDIAMHHFLNLRPMCGPCNSSRSNAAVVY